MSPEHRQNLQSCLRKAQEMGLAVVSDHYGKLPQEVKDRLLVLNNGEEGTMRHWLTEGKVDRKRVFLALLDGTVVGWSIGRTERGRSCAHMSVYVDPNYRRRGIATVLISSARSHYRRRIGISCWHSNEASEFVRHLAEHNLGGGYHH